MPIVVDEVVISVDVENPSSGAGSEAGAARSSATPSEGRQELVAECVERVLEILAQRQER